MNLGAGREFDLIRGLRERWGPLAADIGDDAAVLRVPRGEQMVLSTDTALERIHFRRDWLSLREIGYRAVTAALSDLAAMAAAPIGALVAMQVPSDSATELFELGDGVGDAVRAAGTVVLGGNLSRANSWGVTTTVIGSAFAPVSRAGARPGDFLYVTGALGGVRAAIRQLESKGVSPELRARYARPVARIVEARWLAARGIVAAIDISDGLHQDATHIAAASDVTIEIDAERVPVAGGATADDALAGGEDYELLVASRTPLPESDFAREFATSLTAIGRVVEGGCAVHFTRDGKRVAAPPGYDHFSR